MRVNTLLSGNVSFGEQTLSNYLNVNMRRKIALFFPYIHIKKQEKEDVEKHT